MAYALVGSVGTVAGTGALSTAVTPSFGAGESATAGNLLIAWLVASAGVDPTLPSGWTEWKTGGVGNHNALYFKIASGGDAGPTFAASASAGWWAQVAEFSGNAASSPFDQSGQPNSVGPSSPITATANGVDSAAGELVVYSSVAIYTAAATKTLSSTLNNGATAHDTTNNATSGTVHYALGWGITTGNSAADAVTLTFTTTKISQVDQIVASFKLPSVASVPPAMLAHRSPRAARHVPAQRGRFMVAFPKLWTPRLWRPASAA